MYRFLITICLILHLSFIAYVESSGYRSEFLERKYIVNELEAPGLIQTSKNISSVTICAIACGNEMSCNSYSFLTSERTCTLYAGTTYPEDSGGLFYVKRDTTMPECNNDEFEYNADIGLCYYISTLPALHDKAVDFCSNMGAHLLLIDSDEINNFIISVLPSNESFWIDGERSSKLPTKLEDHFDREMTYFNWHQGEPGYHENCIEINDNSGSGTEWGWNDEDKSFNRFICQKDL